MGLNGVLRTIEGGCLGFWCPGCEEMHVVNVGDPLGGLRGGAGGWTFDGNYDAPTFSPSVLIRSGHYATSAWKPGDPCWCTWNTEAAAAGEKPAPFACSVCHSFVRGGQIQFLSDCTHALAGQTVPLAAPPEHAP